MNTNEKGAVGLVRVMSDLIERGYEVFTPTTDFSPVDLVAATKSMCLRRVQVKYRSLNESGSMVVELSTTINGYKTPIDVSKIDGWAIFCPDTGKVYYVAVNGRNGTQFTIKTDQELTDPDLLWRAI